MRAQLKGFYSLEIDGVLEEYWPEDPTNFGISIRLMIGAESNSSSESFDILVCTPDWIKDQYAEEKIVWGRHMLIVLEYDLNLVKSKINRYIDACTGNDWMEIAHKVSRIGAWEFEDYHSK